jgi:hypothetical protein
VAGFGWGYAYQAYSAPGQMGISYILEPNHVAHGVGLAVASTTETLTVWVSGAEVWGQGWGLGVPLLGLGLGSWVLESQVLVLGLRAWVLGLGSWVLGLGSWVSG